MKQNCWQYKACGRETGGKNSLALGVCPAATEKRLHGVHDGINSGRACWVVAGTLCGGEIQGTFGKKFKNCETCDFYQQVRNQENAGFLLSVTLLNRLRNDPRPAESPREAPVMQRNSAVL